MGDLYMLEKPCSKCKRILPATQFNKANWLASGLRPDCKRCYSETKKDYWVRQPPGPKTLASREQRALRTDGKRRCVICKEIKRANSDDFSVLSQKTGRLETTCRECARLKTKEWAQNNPQRYRASANMSCASRYAAKRHRTPPWLTREQREQMRLVYVECARITRETGIKHHVDHIVPLIGRSVSGLHVPWNLQVITASQNARKHNTWNC